ncbi:hypothetical protein CR194_03750 [Salipaludibacillus keqinensis]|uniref:STAS domain-containing protein n=1 Tax=Salipaludibacillus keqinensis TaxID=2045207 RepID=A0A323TKZ4_9BACI|nr:STAS domain-containing protein [Salipaludibacillus keqinensis]PYZ94654.1 hypothetical protein CR194_03750 [Salipaludibacillus keqinensis]
MEYLHKSNPRIVEELYLVGEELLRNKEWMVRSITSVMNESSQENSHHELTDDELFQIRTEFIDFVASVFMDTPRTHSIEEWANKLGLYAISHGGNLPEILPVVKQYRKIMWEVIEEWGNKNEMLNETIFKASLVLNNVIDDATTAFSAAFIEHHEKKIKETNDFIKEMSAPVVPISKGIAVLPLIGHLDEERSMILMETTVNEIIDHKLDHIFIDLSGVSVIDTYVASRLSDLMKTLKILGVTPILSGLRPEMAQTIVSLGIDLTSFKIVSSLKQALIDFGVCKEI